MTELHPSNGHQIVTEPFSNTRRVTEASERHSIERTSDSAPLLNRSIDRNWEMFVIWSFVIVSFAAFFFCLWVISAKCHAIGSVEFPATVGTTTMDKNQNHKVQMKRQNKTPESANKRESGTTDIAAQTASAHTGTNPKTRLRNLRDPDKLWPRSGHGPDTDMN